MRTTKRGRLHGTIRERSGGFQLRVSYGGRQHTVGTYGDLQAAERERVAVSAAINAGTYVPGVKLREGLPKGATLDALAAEYRRVHKYRGRSLSPDLIETYAMFVRRSPFRETPAAAITPAMVETWYAGRVEAVEANQRARAKGEPFPEPTNKATTLNQLTAEYKHLRTLMAFAESRGLRRPDTNPCQIEGAQTYRAKQPPAPTVAEFWRIIEATPDPMHRAAFALQAAIAIRKGELAGLQRRDLTIEHDPDGTAWLRVRIERAIHWGKAGAWDIGTPKTEGSEREQYAEPEFAAVFLEWFAQQPQIGPESFVFTRSNGKPLGRNTLRRAWESACALAGGHWRMHSSRATVLTAFRERGADFRQIQARGGHSTVQAALRYQQPATLESQKKLLKPR